VTNRKCGGGDGQDLGRLFTFSHTKTATLPPHPSSRSRRIEHTQNLYSTFIADGIGKDHDIWPRIVGQIYLGGER
jgi:hypothetical protein